LEEERARQETEASKNGSVSEDKTAQASAVAQEQDGMVILLFTFNIKFDNKADGGPERRGPDC
jgi:hypothetical protein